MALKEGLAQRRHCVAKLKTMESCEVDSVLLPMETITEERNNKEMHNNDEENEKDQEKRRQL